MAEERVAIFDGVKWLELHEAKKCTLGVHNSTCMCGGYAKDQCCEPSCRKHKCGPRKGCKCPLPEEGAQSAA